MNMDFDTNKTPTEVKKVHLDELILETFILVLMINGIEKNGKRNIDQNYYC